MAARPSKKTTATCSKTMYRFITHTQIYCSLSQSSSRSNTCPKHRYSNPGETRYSKIQSCRINDQQKLGNERLELLWHLGWPHKQRFIGSAIWDCQTAMAQDPSFITEDLNHTYNYYKNKYWDTEGFSFGQMICLTKLNYFSFIVKTIQITVLHSNTGCWQNPHTC